MFITVLEPGGDGRVFDQFWLCGWVLVRLMVLGSQPMVADVEENTYEERGSMDEVKGKCLWVVDISYYGGSWPLMNDKKV